MGELLLCHETIAALPYYIEETGINIYSMEELSYYISGNVYLLDHSFMCESLCTWVEKQMHRVELAQKLRENIRTEGKLSDFVFAILQDTAYCTMKVITEDGTEFGTLSDVMETGANDVYVIDSKEHGEVLMPAIKECVLNVDMESGIITVHLMNGLI